MKTKILIALFGASLSCYTVRSNAQNTYYGTNAFATFILLGGAGTNNSAFGGWALYTTRDGSDNTAIGKNSLYSNTDGSRNTAAGRGALTYNTTASDNSAFGYYSLRKNTTGAQNSAFGANALYSNIAGSNNTAGGYKSLYSNTGLNQYGSNNTAYGNSSLYSNTGNDNTAVGVKAMSANTSGYENTAVGENSMDNNSTGWQNTVLGYGADVGTGALNNATAIGYNAIVSLNNSIRFGDDEVASCGFWNDPDPAYQALVVGRDIATGVFRPGNGAYCSVGGTWTNGSSKEFKEDFSIQDPQAVLNKINRLSITKWKYKKTNEYHIGPVAEDFYEAFNVGCNNKSISTIDPSGVALLGIQALSKKSDGLTNENEQLKKVIEELKKQNSDLEKRIEKLEAVALATSQSTAPSQVSKSISLNNASLEQNIPNPLTNSTGIRYNIPASFKAAQIVITDFSGKTIKKLAIKTAGAGIVNIDASFLNNGTYNYSLLIDGKIIESKKMVIAK